MTLTPCGASIAKNASEILRRIEGTLLTEVASSPDQRAGCSSSVFRTTWKAYWFRLPPDIVAIPPPALSSNSTRSRTTGQSTRWTGVRSTLRLVTSRKEGRLRLPSQPSFSRASRGDHRRSARHGLRITAGGIRRTSCPPRRPASASSQRRSRLQNRPQREPPPRRGPRRPPP